MKNIPDQLQLEIFDLMGDNVPVLMYYVDTDLRYRYANRYFQVLHDINPEDMLGSKISDIIGEEGFREAHQYYERALAGEKVSYESFFTTKQGQPHYYRATYMPHFVNDKVIGFAGLVIDITDIKRSHQIKSEVLQLLSHDMRTPMTSILALLEIEKRHSGEQNESNLLRQIQKHVEKSLKYTTDYLHLAEAENHPGVPFQSIDIETVVHDALGIVQPLANKHQVDLSWPQYLDPPAFIHGNMNMLERAMTNLLDNAIKFSRSGGQVSVLLKRDNNRVVISVIDNGIGISQNEVDVLFDMFSRGSQAGPSEGFGLGLRYVSVVCQQHKGTIQVERNESGGATFSMSLPLLQDENEHWSITL